jgi:DNA-binding NtrC family response regulator
MNRSGKMKKISILILDDEQRICEELSEYLLRKKYAVFSAEKPSAAFDVLKKTSIDILFLDFTLPEMNGIIFLKEVKKMYPKLNVIMISGAENWQIRKEARQNGAIDFISKPFLHKDVTNALQWINNEI